MAVAGLMSGLLIHLWRYMNTHGIKTFEDPMAYDGAAHQYQVVAKNTVGYGGEYMSTTAQSVSSTLLVGDPIAPTILSATATAVSATIGNVTLTWSDVAGEIKYRVEWSTDNFVTVAGRMVAANATTFTTPNIPGGAYQFRLGAQYASGWLWSTPVNVTIPTTVAAPTIRSVTATPVNANLRECDLDLG